MWGPKVALLLALPTLVRGWNIRECLYDDAFGLLSESVRGPAERLRSLLEEHQFLMGLDDEYVVDQHTIGPFESLVGYLQEAIYEIINDLEDGPAPRCPADLPLSLQLLNCLSGSYMQFFERDDHAGFIYNGSKPVRLSAGLDRFQISSKLLTRQVNSFRTVAKAVVDCWAYSQRPFLHPLRDTWLAPYAAIVMEIQPLSEVAIASGELADSLRAMAEGESPRLERRIQDARKRMGEVFADLRGRLNTADAPSLMRSVRDLEISRFQQQSQGPAKGVSLDIASLWRPLLATRSFDILLADYLIQMLYLQLSLPATCQKQDCPGLFKTCDISLGLGLGQGPSSIYAARVELEGLHGVILNRPVGRDAEALQELEKKIRCSRCIFDGAKSLERLGLYLHQFPQSLSNRALTMVWADLSAIVRVANAMLDPIIKESGGDWRERLLLGLLLCNGKLGLYQLLVWAKKVMLVIEEKGIPQGEEDIALRGDITQEEDVARRKDVTQEEDIAQGRDHNTHETAITDDGDGTELSALGMWSQAFEQDQHTKSARSAVADDQVGQSGSIDDASLTGAESATSDSDLVSSDDASQDDNS